MIIVSIDPRQNLVVAAWAGTPPAEAIAEHLRIGNQIRTTQAATVAVPAPPPADATYAPVQQHFVTFYSPGTLFSEQTTMPIAAWDAEVAVEMARSVTERYGAKPYGFCFSTRARADDELDSREVKRSPMHYLGGKVETLEEVEARNDPSERILRSNMRNNGYSRIIVNTNSWKFTGPLNDDDIILDVAI